jgi:hypothetical protein
MSGKKRSFVPGKIFVIRAGERSRRRERVLVTREGYLLTQDDPHSHAVSVVAVMLGAEEHIFEYDVTTVEVDEHGREMDVAWYREKEDGDGD